jgi:hypothetical protein
LPNTAFLAVNPLLSSGAVAVAQQPVASFGNLALLGLSNYCLLSPDHRHHARGPMYGSPNALAYSSNPLAYTGLRDTCIYCGAVVEAGS